MCLPPWFMCSIIRKSMSRRALMPRFCHAGLRNTSRVIQIQGFPFGGPEPFAVMRALVVPDELGLALLVGDIARRLRPVCGAIPADEFDALVVDIALRKLRWRKREHRTASRPSGG